MFCATKMINPLIVVQSLSRVQLFATPWTVAHQPPPSMGFSRQEYWSGLPFPSPGDLPDPGIKPRSPTLQADALTSEPPGKPIFDKGGKNIQWRKDNLLNKWCWENWSTTCERMKLEHFLTPFLMVVQRLKRLPAMWETWVRSLGREDPLEKEMAPHSSILAWKIPWTEEPGRLQSMGSQRVRHD